MEGRGGGAGARGAEGGRAGQDLPKRAKHGRQGDAVQPLDLARRGNVLRLHAPVGGGEGDGQEADRGRDGDRDGEREEHVDETGERRLHDLAEGHIQGFDIFGEPVDEAARGLRVEK